MPTTLPVPSTFYPELNEDRLRHIASSLLDVRDMTLAQMSTPLDDGYTRGTAVFGRSRQKLMQMALQGDLEWMTLSHAGMDVTFHIERVPCRFFQDNPDQPAKPGFFKRNQLDNLGLLFEVNEAEPVMWRFVVEEPLTQEDEACVYFIGYNAYQEKVSEWSYRPSMSTLHAVDQEVPAAARIQSAIVEVHEDSEEINLPLARAAGDS
jgi:hypothetical protein